MPWKDGKSASRFGSVHVRRSGHSRPLVRQGTRRVLVRRAHGAVRRRRSAVGPVGIVGMEVPRYMELVAPRAVVPFDMVVDFGGTERRTGAQAIALAHLHTGGAFCGPIPRQSDKMSEALAFLPLCSIFIRILNIPRSPQNFQVRLPWRPDGSAAGGSDALRHAHAYRGDRVVGEPDADPP